MTFHTEGPASNTPPETDPVPVTTDARERSTGKADSTGERTHSIAVAPKKDSRKWASIDLTFAQFCEWAEEPADHKECGNYIFGTLRDGRRTKDTVESRSAAQLDADTATEATWERLRALGARGLVHTTHSSAPDALRLRAVLPFDRDVTPTEYRHIVERLVDHLGREQFDPSTSQAERFMFRPSLDPKNRDHYRFEVLEGPELSADEWLADFTAEPDELEGDILPRRDDAREAPGVVGAVARAYSFADVIAAYELPYVADGVRWKYLHSDGNAGLHELDGSHGYAFTHQTSDPAHNGGHRVSAFDLVRLHRFGDLDRDASQRAAEELFKADPKVAAEMSDDAPEAGGTKKPGRPSAAQKMVQLAQARYRLILGPDHDLWASRLTDDGQPTPHVLWEEDGSFAEDLRLTHDLDDGKAIASTSAVNDAVAHLRALTRRHGTVERIYRRVARVGDDAFYNLGDRRRVVHIEPGAWSIRDELPAGLNFRLSATMAEQVAPAPPGAGAVEPLWDHLNVPEEDRPLVLAWLVHALLDSDAPHAALLLLGSQGAGKSTATERLSDLVDPTSAHPTRKSSDERAWVIRAMSNWVLVVDNLSHMSAEFSDLLATTATGATVTYRKLYTNGQMVTATLLNPMILNGITVDGMRPDLRDRTVAIQLDRIAGDRRRDAAALRRRWDRDRPVVFGGLLDLAAKVLERDVLGLIDTSATGMARMTGYARTLLAVDSLLGTDGYSVFLGHGHAAAAEAVSADPLLDALARAVDRPRVASAQELLDLAKADPDLPEHLIGDKRPITPRTMANAIRRGAAALEELGWTVHDKAPKGKGGVTLWTLTPPSQDGDDQ